MERHTGGSVSGMVTRKRTRAGRRQGAHLCGHAKAGLGYHALDEARGRALYFPLQPLKRCARRRRRVDGVTVRAAARRRLRSGSRGSAHILQLERHVCHVQTVLVVHKANHLWREREAGVGTGIEHGRFDALASGERRRAARRRAPRLPGQRCMAARVMVGSGEGGKSTTTALIAL